MLLSLNTRSIIIINIIYNTPSVCFGQKSDEGRYIKNIIKIYTA